jgi:DNA-binding CsgD family transcriptional regulator
MRVFQNKNGPGMKKKSRSISGRPVTGEAVQPLSACPLYSFCQERGITAREHEVCQWLIHGKTNAEIATILFISPRTAEKHVHKLLMKMGVENRASAAIELARRVWYPEI